MNPLRRSLLGLYQSATGHERRREMARRSAEGTLPVCILFFHRVADTHPNDWTLPLKSFERQLDWLDQRYEFVNLGEAQRRLTSGFSPRPAVAITFDDGYGDNCDDAISLLLARSIPFTYFVSTRNVLERRCFPHDHDSGVLLRPNTVDELRSMADAGIELGAHTRTHVDLGRVNDPKRIEAEIVGSKRDLEDWTGHAVRYFAFPYGLPKNLSSAACAIAADAGIEGVCSAYGAYNLPDAVSKKHGAFHLRRIHADPEWTRFTNWMTFDTRKARVDPIDDDVFLADLAPRARRAPEEVLCA